MSPPVIRSTDAPEDEPILLRHRRLEQRFEAHEEQYKEDKQEYHRHRQELCADYDRNLELTKEVNKTAQAAFTLADSNAKATAVLVEGVSTVQSIRKFIKWSGSSVILLAAITWLVAHIPELLSQLIGS